VSQAGPPGRHHAVSTWRVRGATRGGHSTGPSDEAAGVTEPMSAGAGDAEKVSFRVGELADDEAAG
jgi:hypothetical protein